jgi:catechol 2,3-dioxygenase-like lactoylglutathione lyase family enzyme
MVEALFHTDHHQDHMVQMVEALEHVALEVQNADVSMRFYSDVFGAVETNRWESKVLGISQIIFMNLGGAVFELIERGGAKQSSQDHGDAGIKHICLRVTNLAAALAMTERMGVKLVQGAMNIDRSRFEPLLSDGTMDLDMGIKRAIVSDPDGIQIELMEK